MNIENLKNFLEDKKEAASVGFKNLKAEIHFDNLINKGGSLYEARVYRDGENILLTKDLQLKGWHPEDTIFEDIKEQVKGPARVTLIVTGENGQFENVFIRKRK